MTDFSCNFVTRQVRKGREDRLLEAVQWCHRQKFRMLKKIRFKCVFEVFLDFATIYPWCQEHVESQINGLHRSMYSFMYDRWKANLSLLTCVIRFCAKGNENHVVLNQYTSQWKTNEFSPVAKFSSKLRGYSRILRLSYPHPREMIHIRRLRYVYSIALKPSRH